jgi:hypothetical protein
VLYWRFAFEGWVGAFEEVGALPPAHRDRCGRAEQRENIPARMSYIERFSKGRTRRVVDGVRARSVSKVREAGPEVFEQLLIRLL